MKKQINKDCTYLLRLTFPTITIQYFCEPKNKNDFVQHYL